MVSVLSLHGRRQWSITLLQRCVALCTIAAGVSPRWSATLWVPFAGTSLCSVIRPIIISSVASHVGGGASEATRFVSNLVRREQVSSKLAAAETNEERLSSFSTPTLACPVPGHMFCPLLWSTASFSAACFCDHQHACPLRRSTFHEPLRALQLDGLLRSSAVRSSPILAVFSREETWQLRASFSAGQVHPLAHCPAVKCWSTIRH